MKNFRFLIASLSLCLLPALTGCAQHAKQAELEKQTSLVGVPTPAVELSQLAPAGVDLAYRPVLRSAALAKTGDARSIDLWNLFLSGGLAIGALLTAPFDAKQRSGDTVTIPVEAATHLYPGGMIARNAAGNAVPASDTAGLRIVGRCEVDADNSLGIAGTINVQVSRGIFLYTNSATDPLAAADIGNMAYVEDDSTVCKVGANNKVKAGRITDIDPVTGNVWIDTRSVAGSVKYTPTSAQCTTAAAVDLATSEALANDLKAKYNALQADVVAMLAKLT